MTARSAKVTAWSGPVLFAISMVVPAQGFPDDPFFENELGYRLVAYSFIGAMDSQLCMLGLTANILFLLASLLLLIRIARRKAWPSFRFISWTAILTAILMTAARIFLVSPHVAYCFAPGFLLWLGGAVSMAIGCWNLRYESTAKLPHGFDVIPLASPAIAQTAVSPQPIDNSPRDSNRLIE